jgi:hypothetical protein
MLVLPRWIEHALNVTVELPQHADARYDCNQILGGGDDVVTRSHENLLSTVRGTSRCKPGFGRASMPSFNSQRQSNPGISWSGIIGTLLVRALVLLALLLPPAFIATYSSPLRPSTNCPQSTSHATSSPMAAYSPTDLIWSSRFVA